MEKVLISHNKHWDKEYTGLYQRALSQKLVENLSTRHIQVLQGIRRSGKSTLFKILINHLMQSTDAKHILYINLEDPFFIKYSNDPANLYEIVETAQKLVGNKIKYLFLDEVQAITGWEQYVKVVYDNEEFEKIFVTGSNSSLLNSEFAKFLSGRYLSEMVFPLSFSEILTIYGITSYFKLNKERPKVLGIVDSMLKYGSFVDVFDNKDEHKREILSTCYDTIILKDCVANNSIRDIKSFRKLSYYLLSNVTSLYSYKSLANAVGIHDKSSKEYVQYLQDAYLLSELKQFSYSLKKQQNNRKKPYLTDNGFINLSFKFSSNSGAVLENLVFSELHKKGKELYCFYNKIFECDFIVKNDDNTFEALQVCHELNDQNIKRETAALKKIDQFIKITRKTIITYNQEKKIKDINIIPFWKFFSNLQ